MGTLNYVAGQTEVWVMWGASKARQSWRTGPLTSGVCANCTVGVSIGFELWDTPWVSEGWRVGCWVENQPHKLLFK